jgi:hypothetical protein
MQLPSYNRNAHLQRQKDFEHFNTISHIDELANILFGINNATSIDTAIIKAYITGDHFRQGADFLETEKFVDGLAGVIMNLIHTASTFGFPNAPTVRIQESKIDIALAKQMVESFEDRGFNIQPGQASSRFVQEFMTQKVFSIIVFWRWRIVTGRTVSEDRVKCSTRNYFYLLWIMAWLFDKGEKGSSERWILLEQMSADSLVQIIERSGIGLRPGFAQAIAKERMKRSSFTTNTALDSLVRGSMKRATLTFATAAMIDDESYYSAICSYLFDWSEENYGVK